VEYNLVNGKPLVYLESVSYENVSEAGQVILVNCEHTQVKNLDLSHATIGIQLWKTNNTTISGNNITNNSRYGVRLDYSSSNSINGNNITNNDYGIELVSSSNDSVSGNNISDNFDGVYLDSSSSNSISGNSITNNAHGIEFSSSSNYNTISENKIINNYDIGIEFWQSSNNKLWHNNFVGNNQQARIETSGYTNVWDDGHPSGGNYWSDYVGTDGNNDGIGDQPYVIDENNTDRYPLMRLCVRVPGDINDDRTVNILDAIKLANAFLATPDKPSWNGDADLNSDNVVNILDAIILASNFGKTA
jgi:parallel beta-helix repeat protein